MFKDKTAVITGASSGIGKAIANAFAREGCHVVLGARSTGKLEATRKVCEQAGVKALAVTTDVSSREDCKHLVEEALSINSNIDFLINNAGISMRALFNDTDLDVIRKLMEVNFWGTVYCSKYALPYLIKSKGWLTGISSVAGFRGLPGRTGYSASKFAMNGFLEALRTENLKSGLHVLTAHPGFTASSIRKTALTGKGSIQEKSPREEGKMMSPEEVAQKILKAMRKNKKVVVLTTQGKLTFWMNKLFNSLMDRIVHNHMAREPDSPF